MERSSAGIGVAIVGCGRISESHIAAIAQSSQSARLVAVADVDADRAAATGQRHRVASYATVDELFQDPAVEAIVVCTPHTQHASVTCAAAAHGRHVLVEKPFALDTDDAKAMVEVCARAGVTLMAAQTRRYFPLVQAARARLSEIGTITHLVYVFATSFDRRSAPAWWESSAETGGLILPMMGSHSLDLSLWFHGSELPETVYAVAGSFNSDRDGFDECGVVLRFASGAIATNALSLNARQYRHECLLIGTDGTLRIVHPQPGSLLGADPTALFVNGAQVHHEEEGRSAFTVQMEEFIGAIREGREPISSGRSILPQMRVLEAARRSVAIGAPVKLASVERHA